MDRYALTAYDDSLRCILDNGIWRTNKRTGKRTKTVFGMMNRYRIDDRFPIMTRRKYWPSNIFKELLWMISGSTNVNDLKQMGCNIWTPWEDREFENKHEFNEGSLGPIYGFQLRHFGGQFSEQTEEHGAQGFDQLQYVIERIHEDPSCRRILINLWNPLQLNQMRLPPCHYSFQIFIDDDRRMSGMLTQRSADFPIGVPANIQFYSALIYMIGQQTNCTPYEFVHSTADSHIYEDQIDAVEEYLNSPIMESPKLKLNKAADIFSYTPHDFELIDFTCGKKIPIPVAV